MAAKTAEHWRNITRSMLVKEWDSTHILDKNADEIHSIFRAPQNDKECVAVAYGTEKPVVGMNAWKGSINNGEKVTEQILQDFLRARGEPKHETNCLYHAEMRIIDFMHRHLPEYIGISKQACLRCAAVLVIAEVKFKSASPKIYDTGWVVPSFIRNNVDRLEKFIADKDTAFKANDGRTYNLIKAFKELSHNNKEDYISYLQNIPASVAR
ncbi:hypothetical protein [Xanthomonas cerealis]|uniref:hypothetical protein n=1 Tax=Xanthomonas cerealis TaxID=3390025 RepID=UPI0013648C08|nr:hypothetical protein [Xanthomonas translucens]UKE46095.1 hypothetical protein KHA79_13225 [Xanthomonas translucens pv. cerealis]